MSPKPLLLVTTALLLAACSSPTRSQPQTNSPSSTQPTASIPTPTQPTSSVAILVERVERHCKIGEYSQKLPTAAAVVVVIQNLGSRTIDTNPASFVLVDADGFLHEPALNTCDNQMPMMSIEPGEKLRGIIPFDIPDNMTPAKLRGTFTDNQSSDLYKTESLIK